MRNKQSDTGNPSNDPFRPLEFAGCLVLVGVVVAAVAIGLETAARLFW